VNDTAKTETTANVPMVDRMTIIGGARNTAKEITMRAGARLRSSLIGSPEERGHKASFSSRIPDHFFFISMRVWNGNLYIIRRTETYEGLCMEAEFGEKKDNERNQWGKKKLRKNIRKQKTDGEDSHFIRELLHFRQHLKVWNGITIDVMRATN